MKNEGGKSGEENDIFGCLVKSGKKERFWWVRKFSLHSFQNTISLNQRENWREK